MNHIASPWSCVRHTRCRVCQGELSEVFGLGPMWISQFPEMLKVMHHSDPNSAMLDTRDPKVPLNVAECMSCGLAQLTHTVPRDVLYRQYWYHSGLNPAMEAQLLHIVQCARQLVTVSSRDSVLDIGANDGTLLKHWHDDAISLNNPHRIGVDPAVNLQGELAKHAEMLLPDYWPLKVYDGPLCKAISSIAMFYDLEDPNAFVREVRRVLHPEGVWCVQFTDLVSMLRANAFDNIVHEHLEYYRLYDLVRLFKVYDLSVCKLERNDTNGGSLRLWVKHGSQVGEPPVELINALGEEESYLQHSHGWLGLAARVAKQREAMNSLMDQAQDIAIYGASTKGNTLLQHYGIGDASHPWVACTAVERSSEKFGKFTVTGVPIVPETWARKYFPEGGLVLVGPWHFKQGIIEREKGKWAKGVRFVFPLPEVEVVEMDV